SLRLTYVCIVPSFFFFFMLRRPSCSTLFPYTTLFRSLGTCAGLIMLARELSDGISGQRTFGGLDVTVQRNAFGSQTESFETDLRSEEHTSELQSRFDLVCRLLLEKKKKLNTNIIYSNT